MSCLPPAVKLEQRAKEMKEGGVKPVNTAGSWCTPNAVSWAKFLWIRLGYRIRRNLRNGFCGKW